MEKLTFDNFKHLVDTCENEEPECIEFEIPTKIRRTKDFNIVSRREVKKITFTVTKRYCIHDNITVPFGYLVNM